MTLLSISQVAQQMGLRASAIRYYEAIGILPSPQRIGGRRRYGTAMLHRLAIVQRARKMGFTLDEIRELFVGFGESTRASARWGKLSQRKLQELEVQMAEIASMQRLLKSMIERCSCQTLEQCGRGIFSSECSDPPR